MLQLLLSEPNDESSVLIFAQSPFQLITVGIGKWLAILIDTVNSDDIYQ